MKFFRRQSEGISVTVIVSIIFGFAAGAVGQIVTDVYVNPYGQDLFSSSFEDSRNISTVIPELRPVKHFLGIEQDFQVNQSIEKVLPATVAIYPKKSTGASVSSQLYLPSDVVAQGFILTSDGWIASIAPVVAKTPDAFVIAHGGRLLIPEIVVTDTVTGVSFIKVGATNLPVIVFGDSDEVNLGQLHLSIIHQSQTVVGTVQSLDQRVLQTASDFVVSSESYDQLLRVVGDFSEQFVGSPVANLGGEVIGIVAVVAGDGSYADVVPLNQFRSVVLDVLRSNIVKRPFLGVRYLDLSRVVGLNTDTVQGQTQGALVFERPASTTPAAELDLHVNDIITSVDGQPVDTDSSLTELVQQYRPGDEITFDILRDGQTLQRSTILSILE